MNLMDVTFASYNTFLSQANINSSTSYVALGVYLQLRPDFKLLVVDLPLMNLCLTTRGDFLFNNIGLDLLSTFVLVDGVNGNFLEGVLDFGNVGKNTLGGLALAVLRD